MFPSRLASRPVMFWDKKVADLNAKILTIFSNSIYLCHCQKVLINKEKKGKEDEQTTLELSSAHRRPQ